ncbi:MAG: ROK family protein, partial [Planctomycetes bacterium]|nr:ROK family protein [Planctomycetota bacterium]
MITIGVDLGGTKTLVAAFGADGELLGQERHATEPERGSAAVLDAIAAAVRRLDAAHGAATAIGVGFAG